MRPIHIAPALVAAMALPTPATAQERQVDEDISLPRAAVLAAPSEGTEPGIAKSAVAATASTDDSSVQLTFSTAQKHLRPDGERFWSVTLEAPLDKSGKQGAFVTEQGLASDFSATFGYSAIAIDLSPPPDLVQQIELDYRQACRDALLKDPAYVALPSQQARLDQEAKTCSFAKALWEMDPTEIHAALAAVNMAGAAEELIKYKRIAHARNIVVVNLKGSIGHSSFDYLDAASFGKKSAAKTPFSFSIAAGINPRSGPIFLAGGYQYRREFEASDKRILCPASASPPPTECTYDVFAAPERNVDHAAFALARFQIPIGKDDSGRHRFGPVVEARVGYDFEDKIWGASVPVYFLVDSDKKLRGGMKFSWEEKGTDRDKDQFKFSIFVVKSFDRLGL